MKLPTQDTLDSFAVNIAEALGKGFTAAEVSELGLTALYYLDWEETLCKGKVPSVEEIVAYIKGNTSYKKSLPTEDSLVIDLTDRETGVQFIHDALTGHNKLCKSRNHYADTDKAVNMIYDAFEKKKILEIKVGE